MISGMWIREQKAVEVPEAYGTCGGSGGLFSEHEAKQAGQTWHGLSFS
jgi:hypothetical protein